MSAHMSRDHPRACGEHYGWPAAGRVCSGSSPRLRGTRLRGLRHPGRCGIIPALAGNTTRCYAARDDTRDHPRACGEHYRLVKLTCRLVWIIPALAGNTGGTCHRCAVGQDHPRACGEHPEDYKADNYLGGSSPRLRGTPHKARAPSASTGIIPALAGNTLLVSSSQSSRWDHPRACGEHFSIVPWWMSFPGSSPRLRGTRTWADRHRWATGIIPALAGNTPCRWRAVP